MMENLHPCEASSDWRLAGYSGSGYQKAVSLFISAGDSHDLRQNKITFNSHQYQAEWKRLCGEGSGGGCSGWHWTRLQHRASADSPKDSRNLFYNRLVSARVENVTTYLCWQDANPKWTINHLVLAALLSKILLSLLHTSTSYKPPLPWILHTAWWRFFSCRFSLFTKIAAKAEEERSRREEDKRAKERKERKNHRRAASRDKANVKCLLSCLGNLDTDYTN